jgi:hypothetical protein
VVVEQQEEETKLADIRPFFLAFTIFSEELDENEIITF